MNDSLYLPRKAGYALYEVALAKANDQQLTEISNELALGLSLQEMQTVQAYFKTEDRNPTDLEMQTISQTWSEHCYHKTFKGKIQID
jgi:phosphoribosylformylglycinamidine synthase